MALHGKHVVGKHRAGPAIAVGLLGAWLVALGAGFGVEAQTVTTPRFGEAVVVAGSEASPLLGAPTDEIWAYARREAGWVPVWVQVDERDEDGVYVEQEDARFDENDELIVLYADLGAAAPEGAWPAQVEPGAPAVELEAADPLLPDRLGSNPAWLYLFAAPEPAGHDGGEPPPMRHDVSAGFLGSPHYEMVFASAREDRFIGPKTLRAFGSETNLIDRFKIRMTVIILFGLAREEITEEDIAAQSRSLGLTDPPRRLGPLRVVLDDEGHNVAYPSRATLFRGAVDESDLPLGVDGIEEVRLSLDLSPDAIGNRYHDSNLEAAGVAIDGMPDAVPERPVPDWRSIELPGGKLIFLPRPGASGSKARGYYRDGGDPEEGDTGDGRHVGEAGVYADSVDAFVEADFPGEMIFVPDAYEVDVTRLIEEAKAPLEIRVERWGDAPATGTVTATHTPTEPVVSSATPGPTATPAGPTPVEPTPAEASPTADPGQDGEWSAYLPWLNTEP